MHEYTSAQDEVISGVRGYQCGFAKPVSMGLPSYFKVMTWHYTHDMLAKQIPQYDGVMNTCTTNGSKIEIVT